MSFTKLRVAVLRGGEKEFSNSLQNGEEVLKHLRSEEGKYEPLDLFLTEDGLWHHKGLVVAPDRMLDRVDLAWNSLYGGPEAIRELDRFKVPYTGSSRVAIALSENVNMSRRMYRIASLATPRHTFLNPEVSEEELLKIFRSFLSPLRIRGVKRNGLKERLVHSYNEMKEILAEALSASGKVLVEELIKGKESECGVVENARGEKYYTFLPSGGQSRSVNKEIEKMAKQAHEALGLRHYSLSRFVISPAGKVYILETSSNPDISKGSYLEKAFNDTGWRTGDFIDHVINLAQKG